LSLGEKRRQIERMPLDPDSKREVCFLLNHATFPKETIARSCFGSDIHGVRGSRFSHLALRRARHARPIGGNQALERADLGGARIA